MSRSKIARKPARRKSTRIPAAKAAPKHLALPLLGRIEGRLLDAMKAYGCILHGVPTTGIPSIPDVLAQIAVEVHLVRHMVEVTP